MEIDVRDMPYLVDITQVTSLPGYQIHVTFDDGNSGTYDMRPYLDHGVFRALRDPDVFSRVHVAYGTVVWYEEGWPCEIDVAPERIWTDCEPDGEDWRTRLLPAKYFA